MLHLLIKIKSFNINKFNKILRNLSSQNKLLSQDKTQDKTFSQDKLFSQDKTFSQDKISSQATNSIQSFKESIDANVNLIIKNIQRNDLIKSTKSKHATKYSNEEIRILFGAVMEHGRSWKLISEKYFSSKRSPLSLSIKWTQIHQDDKIPLSFYIKDKKHYTKEWTKEEDKILIKKVNEYGVGNWAKISTYLPKKSTTQISYRYKTLLFPSKRRKWSEENDQSLLDLVENFGKNWIIFSEIFKIPYYNVKSRYTTLTKPPKLWTDEENIKLNKAIIEHGENWDEITKLFPDRELKDIQAHYRSNSKLNPFVNVGKWNTSEIKKFEDVFKEFGKDWKSVSKFIKTRSPVQCYSYWKYQYVCKKKKNNNVRIDILET